MTIFEIDPEAARHVRPSRQFPVLLQISIARRLWGEFERRFADSSEVFVLTGVPSSADEHWMTAYLAVSSREIAERLDHGWDGHA